MKWLRRLFSSPPLPPLPRPHITSVPISLEKGGVAKVISVEEFSSLTGARFAPWIEMENSRIHKKIGRQGAKLRRKEKLVPLQIWQGSYFLREIETGYLPPVVVRWVSDQIGWGVFAARDFTAREYIAQYTGVLRKWRRSDRKNGYCFEYVHLSGESTPFLIDAREQGGIARYINHSANPNLYPTLATVGDITRVILLTKQRVLKGEQLSYDYGPAYWAHRKAPILI